MHAKLFIGSSSLLQGVQQLRVDHGTTCLQRMLSEEVGVQELKRAIYVSHVNAKHPADQQLPSPGIEFAHPGVLAIYAIANDRIVAIDEEEERSQVTDVKLPIGIHKKGEFPGLLRTSTHQGGTIALIDGMGDETNPRVSSCERSQNRSCLIRAAIVADNDLKIHLPAIQHEVNGRDRIGNHLRFIIGW